MRALPLLLLLPSPLWAEVCDKERPNWDGTPLTAWGEALHFWTSVPGFTLAAMAVLVLALRRPWPMGAIALVAFVPLGVGLIPEDEIFLDITLAALREGCLGDPSLLRLSLALLITLLLWQAQRTAHPSS